MLNQLKYELYNVLSGKSEVRFGATIQTIAGYLSDGTPPGSGAENTKHFKEQEEQRLVDFISNNNLWLNDIDFS